MCKKKEKKKYRIAAELVNIIKGGFKNTYTHTSAAYLKNHTFEIQFRFFQISHWRLSKRTC